MLPEDVVATLLHMGVSGERRKDGSVKVDKQEIREWVHSQGIVLTSPVDSEGFIEWEQEEEEEGEAEEDDDDDDEESDG